jgi:hypothetical protein
MTHGVLSCSGFVLVGLVFAACSSSSNADSTGARDATSESTDGAAGAGDAESGTAMDVGNGNDGAATSDGEGGPALDSGADGDAADLCLQYGLQAPAAGGSCSTGFQLTCAANMCHFAGYCETQGYPCDCCGPSSILGHDGGDASAD